LSDEEDRRLENVRQILERRGFVLHLNEVAPGKWRADAWPISLANPAGASSATGAGDSKMEAAEQLLALIDRENREVGG
jgi:hypothetical protein